MGNTSRAEHSTETRDKAIPIQCLASHRLHCQDHKKCVLRTNTTVLRQTRIPCDTSL